MTADRDTFIFNTASDIDTDSASGHRQMQPILFTARIGKSGPNDDSGHKGWSDIGSTSPPVHQDQGGADGFDFLFFDLG